MAKQRTKQPVPAPAPVLAPTPNPRKHLRPGWPPSAYDPAELWRMLRELEEIQKTLLDRRAALAPGASLFVADLVEWRRLVIAAALAHEGEVRKDLVVRAGDYVELGGKRWIVRTTPTDEERIIYVDRQSGSAFSSQPVCATGLEPYEGPLTPEELAQREELLTRVVRSRSTRFGGMDSVFAQAKKLAELDAPQPPLTEAQRREALSRPELSALRAEDADAPAPLAEPLPAATLATARAARLALTALRAAAWSEWATMQTWLDAREDARMFDGGADGDDESLRVADAARRHEWRLAAAAILTLRELALARALTRERAGVGSPLRLRANVRRAELRLSRARAQCADTRTDRSTPCLLCGPALVSLGSRQEQAALALLARLSA